MEQFNYNWDNTASEIINSGYHTIIAGTTGSGKSTMLDTLLYNICQCEPNYRNFDVIDLKRVSVMDWKNFPHCQKYATTREQAESVLEDAIKLMNSIYHDMESKGLKESPYGYHYIIIDECADLVTESKKEKTGDAETKNNKMNDRIDVEKEILEETFFKTWLLIKERM